MKKELLLISCLSVLVLAGCGASGGSTSDLEEIGKAMEKGTAMTCIIEAADENAPATANMTYYIDGENIRVESDFNGQKMTAIQKGEETFVEPNAMMGETDCDWIVTDPEEEEAGEGPDFDYEQYEEDPMFKMICTPGAVDGSKFDTSGKTCTMEDMMQSAMENMMPEGMDLSGIDMSQFQ